MCVYLAMFANVHLVHLGNTVKWWVVSKKLLFKQIFAPQVFNNKRKIDLVGKIVDTCTHFLLIIRIANP